MHKSPSHTAQTTSRYSYWRVIKVTHTVPIRKGDQVHRQSTLRNRHLETPFFPRGQLSEIGSYAPTRAWSVGQESTCSHRHIRNTGGGSCEGSGKPSEASVACQLSASFSRTRNSFSVSRSRRLVLNIYTIVEDLFEISRSSEAHIARLSR